MSDQPSTQTTITVAPPQPSPIAITPTPAAPLTPRSLLDLTADQWQRLFTFADIVAASPLNIAKNGRNKLSRDDIIIVWMQGLELGLPQMAALKSIDMINGTPTLDPQGMLALINQRGNMEDMTIESTDTYCSVMMKRKGRSPHTERFSIEDANRLITTDWTGDQKRTITLAEKSNWKQQPRTMLKWRAVAACARVVFPDVILGLYTQEEMGADVAISDDGHMTVIQPPAPPHASKPVSILNGDGKPRRIPQPDMNSANADGSAAKSTPEIAESQPEPPAQQATQPAVDGGDQPYYDEAELRRLTRDLYEPGESGDYHHRASIDGLIAGTAKFDDDADPTPYHIQSKDGTVGAIARVVAYRAWKDHRVKLSEALAAFNPEVKSFAEWWTRGDDVWRTGGAAVRSAWGAVQEYAANVALPPAAARQENPLSKSMRKAKAKPQTVAASPQSAAAQPTAQMPPEAQPTPDPHSDDLDESLGLDAAVQTEPTEDIVF